MAHAVAIPGGLPALMAHCQHRKGTTHLSLADFHELTHKKKPTPLDTVKKLTALNELAHGTAVYTADKLYIHFVDAHLASLNQLLAVNRFAQAAYAKGWHALAARTLASVTGVPVAFNRVEIRVIRQAPRRLDADNVVAKAMVDGLRHAGLMPDDTPDFVEAVPCRQRKGPYGVFVEVVEACARSRPGGAAVMAVTGPLDAALPEQHRARPRTDGLRRVP